MGRAPDSEAGWLPAFTIVEFALGTDTDKLDLRHDSARVIDVAQAILVASFCSGRNPGRMW
jgi:hypothetical protein